MRLVVLYGSQTGTAQDVAEQIWRESKRYGFKGPVLSVDDFPIDKLTAERFVVFVVSTTGDGDEPDNMRRTWKFLLRRSLPRDSLRFLNYGCLGLGDSSYAKFNYAAKKLNKRLQQLGAKELLPIGLCDDQHDFGPSGVALPWISRLWEELSKQISQYKIEQITNPVVMKWRPIVVENIEKSVCADLRTLRWPYKVDPIELTLKTNQRTTAPEHFQDVRFLQFHYPMGTTSWNAGDVLEIRPNNSDADVVELIKLLSENDLKITENTIVELCAVYEEMPLPLAYSKPVTIGQLAKYVWDLKCKPRQRVFELMSINCLDEMEYEKLKEFTTAVGLEDLIGYVNRPRRTLLEVLQDFPHATARLTLPILCELFPFIQTRSFSIASMPNAVADNTLDLLVAVVEYKTKLSTPRRGLCSNWLKELPTGSVILGTIKSGTMSLPEELSTPLIMIGPGTGIAPFRSVIQKRELAMEDRKTKCGQMIVFFGCRNRSMDFHFENEFTAWKTKNLLTAFFAFSRDQADKVYVQHLIKKQRELLAPLIKNENAVILVAGASNNMPKDVREAFAEILDKDDSYIDEMIKAKRYQEETWS